MPEVVAKKTPADLTEENLLELEGIIQRTIAAFPELAIPASEVEVDFPMSRLSPRPDTPVFVHIVGLFDKRERTPDVFKRLTSAMAHNIANFIQQTLGRKICVKVLAAPFPEEKGGYFETDK